jgi:hypothetical protein
MLTACSSSNLDVELGDSCAPVGSEVFYQGIYKSDRGVCGDYYCWTYIRFFQDCTYESVAAFEENTNTVAKDFFLSSENIEKKQGRYSIEGATLKMKSENNEHVGIINNETLTLKFFSPVTKKSGNKTYQFFQVDAMK